MPGKNCLNNELFLSIGKVFRYENGVFSWKSGKNVHLFIKILEIINVFYQFERKESHW